MCAIRVTVVLAVLAIWTLEACETVSVTPGLPCEGCVGAHCQSDN